MSEGLTIRFGPGGKARTIYSDHHAAMLKKLGFSPPRRASHVEPIAAGPDAWKWLVDLSPLGEEFQFCLWPPAESREAALAAEHFFIQANWVETSTPGRLKK